MTQLVYVPPHTHDDIAIPVASVEEILAGVVDDKAITPEGLAGALPNLQSSVQIADFFTATTQIIAVGIERVQTQAYNASVHASKGAAVYRISSAIEVASYPATTWFISANDRYFLLDEPWVSPLHLGAIGDGATNDAAIVQFTRDFCVTTGRPMKIDAYFNHTGTLLLENPIALVGIGRHACGIYMDVDRTINGIHIMTSDCSIVDMEVKASIPETIQNGQGNYGTCISIGEVYYPVERDDDGALIIPGLVKGTVLRNLLLSRGDVGAAAAIAYVGRCSGAVAEDIIFEGASSSDGRHANCLLTHWGTSGENFPAAANGELKEPLILQKPADAYAYHPNNFTGRRWRLRNCGRVCASTGSYNIDISDVDYDGYNDGASGNGTAAISLQCGDETDRIAHPDDEGKVYANFRFANFVMWNLVGSAVNTSIAPLIDLNLGQATSKYLNADGSLAEDDLWGEKTYDPPSISGGGTTTTDVTVTGLTSGMTPTAWFSVSNSSITVTAAYFAADTARVTFTNTSGGAIDLGSGDLVVTVREERLQAQPYWRNIVFENWTMKALGDTINLIDCRNANASITFDRIVSKDTGAHYGMSISQCRGSFSFNDCWLPGKLDLNVVQGFEANNCNFFSTATMTLTVTSTASFGTFNSSTGLYDNKAYYVYVTKTLADASTERVRGVVSAVTSSTSMRVKLIDTSWDAIPSSGTVYLDAAKSGVLPFDAQTGNFTLGDIVTGGMSGAKGIVTAQTDSGTSGILYIGQVSGVFADNEAITSPSGGAAVANIYSTAYASFAIFNDECIVIDGETETDYLRVTGREGKQSITFSNRLAYDAAGGNFTTGETVTGGTSSASGVILAQDDAGTTGTLYLGTISGTFADNETITGGTSTTTATSNIPSGVSSGIPNDLRIDDRITFRGTALAYDARTAAFNLAATVTGGSSTATGRIIAIQEISASSTGILYLDRVSGTFSDNEALTDNGGTPGGATSNIPNGTTSDVGFATTYLSDYYDTTTATVEVKALPLDIALGTKAVLDRRSQNIQFNNCAIRGGRIGIDAGYCYGVQFNGGSISDCGLYGALIDAEAIVDMDGVTIYNNGLYRTSLSTASNTRDVIIAAGGTLRGQNLIFRESSNVAYNVLSNVGAYGGYVKDSRFIGKPYTDYILTNNPQTDGGYFIATGNRNSVGATIDGAVLNATNKGTAATGTTALEYGDGMDHQTVLTVSTTLPSIAGGADLAVGKLLYTFPAGTLIVDSARMNLSITQTTGKINADTPDGGIGTTIASGAVAVLGGTAAFENIVTGQTFNNCTGTAENIVVTNQSLTINTADAHTVYFNVADGWAASGDPAAILAGTVTLNWTYMGS